MFERIKKPERVRSEGQELKHQRRIAERERQSRRGVERRAKREDDWGL